MSEEQNTTPAPGGDQPQGSDAPAGASETGAVKPAEAVQDSGLIAFIENLKAAGAEASEDRALFDGLAKQAAEDQPAHGSVSEGLGSIAAMLGTAANIGEGIAPNARRKHRDDYERGEKPRKGKTNVEAKADVERGVREGAF